MSKQTKSMFGTIYDALPEDPGEDQRCNIEVSQSVCRVIKEEKESTQKEKEIEAMKQICQFYNTFDVCELADMKVI